MLHFWILLALTILTFWGNFQAFFKKYNNEHKSVGNRQIQKRVQNLKTFNKNDTVWWEVCLNSLRPRLYRWLKKNLMKFYIILSTIKDEISRKKCTFLETKGSKVVGNRQSKYFCSQIDRNVPKVQHICVISRENKKKKSYEILKLCKYSCSDIIGSFKFNLDNKILRKMTAKK